jgi:hypothetical protein
LKSINPNQFLCPQTSSKPLLYAVRTDASSIGTNDDQSLLHIQTITYTASKTKFIFNCKKAKTKLVSSGNPLAHKTSR